MQLLTVTAALLAIVPSVWCQLSVNTPPNVVECQPILFTWSGGTPPYYMSLIPAGQVSAPPFKVFADAIQGTSYSWLVDFQANTNFDIELKDATGATVYSSAITVLAGTSSSCLNTLVTESVTNVPSTTGTSSTPSGSGTSSSATSRPSSSSSAGRVSITSSFGIAGLMGLIGAALF